MKGEGLDDGRGGGNAEKKEWPIKVDDLKTEDVHIKDPSA